MFRFDPFLLLAQNRLVALDNNGANIHIYQHYDGLNRIIARDTNGVITTNVWDKWDLIEEHYGNGALKRCYLHGAATNEMVVSFDGGTYGDAYYHQDARGNTTHLTDGSNNVIEHYTYYVSGQPSYYTGNNSPLSASAYDNRFLFGGALYSPETSLYDMRNRFYLPNIGRFLQSDPIGFAGDPSNLYRYCGNNPVNGHDPSGLQEMERPKYLGGGDLSWVPRVTVWGAVPGAEAAGPSLGIFGPGDFGVGPGLGAYYGPGNSDHAVPSFGSNSQLYFKELTLPQFSQESTQPNVDNSDLAASNWLPTGGGFALELSGGAGWGEGIFASDSYYAGAVSGEATQFVSGGGFFGGPSGALMVVESSQKSVVGGASVGPSAGFWATNAQSASQLWGPFNTYAVNTTWLNVSVSYSNRIYVIAVTMGGPGLSYSQYSTTTVPVGHP